MLLERENSLSVPACGGGGGVKFSSVKKQKDPR
jgi:hypothetical protein